MGDHHLCLKTSPSSEEEVYTQRISVTCADFQEEVCTAGGNRGGPRVQDTKNVSKGRSVVTE